MTGGDGAWLGGAEEEERNFYFFIFFKIFNWTDICSTLSTSGKDFFFATSSLHVGP
jgi:hypothetical protein